MDHLGTLVGMYKYHCDIQHWLHKVMGCKDPQQEPVYLLNIEYFYWDYVHMTCVSRYFYLRGLRVHCVNGSPIYPSGHVQIGMCAVTWQSAYKPHEPGQGSWHFCLMQACILEHSALIVHSGWQLGGCPIYAGKQEHDGTPLILRH